MLQTRRERNGNFIMWEAVTAGELRFFTPGGPVDWRHEIAESPEWPPALPQETLAAWEDIVQSITPPDEELLKLAERYPPPQEWFKADEECPF